MNNFKKAFQLAKLDIKERYIRSIIGPFWITISMLLTIICLGVVFNFLFKQSLADFFPYLGIGLIFWSYINSTILEACKIGQENRGNFKNYNINYDFYIAKHVFKQTFVLFHHLIIILLIMLWFNIKVGPKVILIAISLISSSVLLFYLSKIVFYLSTRFNDLEQIIMSLLTFSFYLTPIIWKKKFLSEYQYLVDYNPFYHIIHIFRSLLLNEPMYLKSLVIVIAMILVLILVSKIVEMKLKKQLIFWI